MPGAGAAGECRCARCDCPAQDAARFAAGGVAGRAAGGLRIETADADTLPSMLDDLFRLHEARWRSRGEPGVLADPAVRGFHRDAAPALAAEGMLRLYRLRIGEAVAAVYYGFAWRDRAYAYIGGFDPDMPRLSPGALITASRDRRSDRRGMRRVRFPARRREL